MTNNKIIQPNRRNIERNTYVPSYTCVPNEMYDKLMENSMRLRNALDELGENVKVAHKDLGKLRKRMKVLKKERDAAITSRRKNGKKIKELENLLMDAYGKKEK